MKKSIWVILAFFFYACKENEKADLILLNAKVYTSDTLNLKTTAFAVKNGKFLFVGSDEDVKRYIGPNSLIRDMNMAFVMPGLIEGHGHFLSMGKSLMNLNLLNTKSWKEIIDSVSEITKRTPKGQWIEGRGWHQDKWNDQLLKTFNAYPYHDELSKISPDHPVILYHSSGHALIANALAMNLAAVNKESSSPPGGRIVKDDFGNITGVFEENAMDIVESAYKHYMQHSDPNELIKIKKRQAISASQKAIYYGITSFQDAGSSLEEIRLLKDWTADHTIEQRMYVMLYEPIDSLSQRMKYLPIIGADEARFKCKAIKLYMDGALGSYGAWLLDDYSDNPGVRGQNLIEPGKILEVSKEALAKNLQVCIHAIGDRGNKEVLDVFESCNADKAGFQDMRWRIEHAQHIRRADIERFNKLGIIASMQAIHCTSDAPFVIKRLGYDRAKNTSYVWRSLLDSGVHLANGTDTPVESINPFECIFAAVTRRRMDSQDAFFPEECMSREEALFSYTIWNAYASGDEKIKGSISKGKYADFIVLDRDLSSCKVDSIPGTKVLEVFIEGQKK